jgi:hypothetical protein
MRAGKKGVKTGWEKARVEDEQRFSSLISQSASLDDLKRMFEMSLSKK